MVLARLFIAGILYCGAALSAQAQEATRLEPSIFKVALDNDRIRVLNATFKPGAKSAVHSHPNHLIYMLTEGTLVFSPAGKTPYEVAFKAGEAMWFPALTQGLENAGDGEVRMVITEVKEGGRSLRAGKAKGGKAKVKRKRKRA